jgi:hypothetical protein
MQAFVKIAPGKTPEDVAKAGFTIITTPRDVIVACASRDMLKHGVDNGLFDSTFAEGEIMFATEAKREYTLTCYPSMRIDEIVECGFEVLGMEPMRTRMDALKLHVRGTEKSRQDAIKRRLFIFCE